MLQHTLTRKLQIRYLDGGILEPKAVCWVYDLGEGGTMAGGVEEGRLWALGELKEKDWGLGGGMGTGVLGGTEGPEGLGEGPKKLNPLWAEVDGEGAPQEEATE